MELALKDISAPGTDPHATLSVFLNGLPDNMGLSAPNESAIDFRSIVGGGKVSQGKGNWFDEFHEGKFSLDSTEGLAFCRLVARMAAATTEKPDEGWNNIYFFTSAWVEHLISPAGTTQRFFLQEYCSRDAGLYDSRTLRPMHWDKEPKWRNAFKRLSHWDERPDWRKAYPWLKHPENLTITELELVLAIFRPFTGQESGLARWARACGLSHSWLLWTCFPKKMQEGGARFAGWIERYPHLLWQIHRFLLSRYCFQLLPAFREALRAGRRTFGDKEGGGSGNGAAEARGGKDGGSTLYAPPFRAGEFLTLYPRIAGLVSIGFLGLMEVDLAQVLFFATSWLVAFVAGVAAIVLLFVLNYMDIYKQNRGVMNDRRHGGGRAWGLLTRFLGWGAFLTALYVFLVHLSGNAQESAIHDWPSASPGPTNGLWNLLIPKIPAWGELWVGLKSSAGREMAVRLISGLFAMAASSCLLGALLQWFFEDTAATEPI